MQPTQQTIAEAERVDLVYTYVLSQMGASTTAEVLALWQDVPVGQAAATASTWLKRATQAILTRRFQARALGLAYYRLVRALRTGSTIASPFKEEPKVVSLEMLRQEFEALVAEQTGDGSAEVTAQVEPDGEGDSVAVETISGLSEALEADESASESYVNQSLTDLANYSQKAIDGLPAGMANGDAKAKANEMHATHGAMVAATGAQAAMNGSRNVTNQASTRDGRVTGWIRVGVGESCHFCSMMLSRGPVYKSAWGAGKGARNDGRVFLGDGLFKYHNNCDCTAEPVYGTVSITDPKYAENLYYQNLWNKHIKDKFSGDDAVNEWRKLLRRIRANETKKAAPEAA